MGVAYTLRALVKAFFGETKSSTALQAASGHALAAISMPERIGAVLLLATTLLVGIYPRLLLDLIRPSFDSPLMQALVKGGGL